MVERSYDAEFIQWSTKIMLALVHVYGLWFPVVVLILC